MAAAHDVSTTRTFALAGHRSSGKTSLADLLLCTAGVTRTLGSVESGTSLLDHEPEERKRRMTLAASFAWLEWEGHLLNLIDTPGADGLAHEQALSLSCVDGAVVLVDGSQGMHNGTRRVLAEVRRSGAPALIVLNHMDRCVDPRPLVQQADAEVGAVRMVPLQVPLLDDDGRFCGVVSLLERRALRYAQDGSGAMSYEPIPEHLGESVRLAWEHLVESVALTDDGLLEQYLEELDLPPEQLRKGLARAVGSARLMPVLYASASHGIGAHPILDAIAWALPSPATRKAPWALTTEGDEIEIRPDDPFVAQHIATRLDDEGQRYHIVRVWSGRAPTRKTWVCGETGQTAKVHKLYQLRGPRASAARYDGPGAVLATWDPLGSRPGETWTAGERIVLGAAPQPPPMLTWMLVPVSKRDQERLVTALDTLGALDPALEIGVEELTGSPTIAGVGQDHLDRALELLHGRLGVTVRPTLPPVGYRETPAGAVTGVTGTHRRLADGAVEEFGACAIDVMPVDPAEGYTFYATVDDDQLPHRFVPAIDEGIRRGMQHGPLAGYPVAGVGVRCTGGEYDILQSNEDHFRHAGERALKTALERSGTRLLEPWHLVEVRSLPDDVGVILSELAARRGRILGMEVTGEEACVYAECPYRELRTFGPRLQSLTHGRGRFTAAPRRYDVLPAAMVKDAVAASPFKTRSC